MNETENFVDEIVKFWDDHGDPRTKQWLLTKNLYPICGIIFGYLMLVMFILPALVQYKKRPKFKSLLAVYYLIHSAVSFYFVVLIIVTEEFDLRCKKLVQNYDEFPMFEVTSIYFWFWFKLSEMIETFLAIICYGRAQKFNVIHHSVHPLLIAYFLHFHPGGPFIYFGFINNVEHTALYFIIALRLLSQKFKKNTDSWFKKFHIIISIGALLLSIVYFAQLKSTSDCTPFFLKVSALASFLIFLYLSVVCRWRYISSEDCFGQTKLVMWINQRAQPKDLLLWVNQAI